LRESNEEGRNSGFQGNSRKHLMPWVCNRPMGMEKWAGELPFLLDFFVEDQLGQFDE
jgi:hypothetical protein